MKNITNVEIILGSYASWALIGVILFYILVRRMERWTGKKIWKERETYFMFLPAALVGPLVLIHIIKDNKFYRTLRKHDGDER